MTQQPADWSLDTYLVSWGLWLTSIVYYFCCCLFTAMPLLSRQVSIFLEELTTSSEIWDPLIPLMSQISRAARYLRGDPVLPSPFANEKVVKDNTCPRSTEVDRVEGNSWYETQLFTNCRLITVTTTYGAETAGRHRIRESFSMQNYFFSSTFLTFSIALLPAFEPQILYWKSVTSLLFLRLCVHVCVFSERRCLTELALNNKVAEAVRSCKNTHFLLYWPRIFANPFSLSFPIWSKLRVRTETSNSFLWSFCSV